LHPIGGAEFDNVAVHDDGECLADEVGVGCCVCLQICSHGFNSFICFDVGVEGDDVTVEEARVWRDLVLDGGEALEEIPRVRDGGSGGDGMVF